MATPDGGHRMSHLAELSADEYTSRVVWRYGGHGADVDWPGVLNAFVIMLGVYAAEHDRRARRRLFTTLAEIRHQISGRAMNAGALRLHLLRLLDALREAAPASHPVTETRTLRPPDDVARQITPARGGPALAGALAGGCALGRAPN